MNRWLLIGSLAGLLSGATGCLHHHTRGGCNTCGTASSCSTGNCQDGCQGHSTGGGLLGKLRNKRHACGCGVAGCGGCGAGRTGCVAGPLGWQQGGLDYSSHLQPGVMGHQAAQQLRSQPFTPGPPTAQVGYPYYTVRGPRDFLLDNPPTIGR